MLDWHSVVILSIDIGIDAIRVTGGQSRVCSAVGHSSKCEPKKERWVAAKSSNAWLRQEQSLVPFAAKKVLAATASRTCKTNSLPALCFYSTNIIILNVRPQTAAEHWVNLAANDKEKRCLSTV